MILQNRTNDNTSATANTLKLAGDLQNRTIKLGKLNISSNNSIELMKNGANGTKVSLTMDANNAANSIIAKNVKVPANGELTWKPGDNYGTGKASVALSPSRNFAAVGGTTVAEDGSADTGLSGKITMNNINLSLDMPAGSTASGVGPAVSNAERLPGICERGIQYRSIWRRMGRWRRCDQCETGYRDHEAWKYEFHVWSANYSW